MTRTTPEAKEAKTIIENYTGHMEVKIWNTGMTWTITKSYGFGHADNTFQLDAEIWEDAEGYYYTKIDGAWYFLHDDDRAELNGINYTE